MKVTHMKVVQISHLKDQRNMHQSSCFISFECARNCMGLLKFLFYPECCIHAQEFKRAALNLSEVSAV